MFLCCDSLTLKNSLNIGRKKPQTPGRLIDSAKRQEKGEVPLHTFLEYEYMKISLEDYLNLFTELSALAICLISYLSIVLQREALYSCRIPSTS